MGPIEVGVVVLILGAVLLLTALALSRSREAARTATCMRNLHQIGVAVELYEQAARRLPPVARLGDPPSSGSSPLVHILRQLGVVDFEALEEGRVSRTPAGSDGSFAAEHYIPGFVCPADPIATSRVFPAPVSYRANAGDTPDGTHGPFSPGAVVGSADVEAGDGAGYTAAFTERLVGSADRENQPIRDYALVPGPVSEPGCPRVEPSALRGDAGRSWAELSWRSTLYTHVPLPNATASCISEDGRTAFMGASSGHVRGIHLLMMDGSVRVVTETIDPGVWSAFGSYSDLDQAEAPPAPLGAGGPARP